MNKPERCLILSIIFVLAGAALGHGKIVEQPVPLGTRFLLKASLESKNDARVLVALEKELMDLVIRERMGKTDFVFEAGSAIQSVFGDAARSVFQEVQFSDGASAPGTAFDYAITVRMMGYNIRLSKVLVGRQVVDLYLEDPFHVAAMSWMCALLAESKDARYAPTLEQIAAGASNGKIQKAAKKGTRTLSD